MNKPSQSQPEERREHARYSADLRVQLLRSDTVPILLHTVELSEGGMHVECDRAQAQLLAPPNIGEGQEFTARVTLIEPGMKRRALTLSAIVKTTRELGQDHYRVGLHFQRFFGKSQEMLDEFISVLKA